MQDSIMVSIYGLSIRRIYILRVPKICWVSRWPSKVRTSTGIWISYLLIARVSHHTSVKPQLFISP